MNHAKCTAGAEQQVAIVIGEALELESVVVLAAMTDDSIAFDRPVTMG